MKKLIALLIVFSLLVKTFAQTEENKSWIDAYQASIVSIGNVISAKDPKTKEVKNIFNIVGTGMIFYVNAKNQTIPCLVTAKHIFQDNSIQWYPEKLNLRLFRFQNLPLDSYMGFEIKLKNLDKKLWIELDDKNTDLACIPLFNIESELKIDDLKIFPYRLFANEDDYYEGAQLMVFGYPGILEPDFRTRAIVRHGIISWIDPNNPEENIILIDCDLYPGNSGGPVMKIPSTMDKYGNIKIGDNVRFLGIVSAKRATKTPLFDSSSNQIVDSTGKPAFTWESVGIGVIESAKKVRKLLNKTQKMIEDGKY